MLWSFRAQDYIQLPHFGEAGMLTLVEELVAVARATPNLPPNVEGALDGMLSTSADLNAHIAKRERAGSTADPRARAADRALDDAWGAFQSWLLGWTRLPDRAHPLITTARELYASLFPKGLQFLTLDFKDEWNESQQRLDHINEAELDLLIAKLGGAPFHATLLRCHRAYGEALHIVGPPDGHAGEPDPDAHVRRALDEAHLALREYVAQIAATVRRTDIATLETATLLLEPLSARASAEAHPADFEDATIVS